MRDAFASHLTLLAQSNKNIVLLSGDIGNRMFDKYKLVAPDRFFNCGIAEASMMSVASGLALSGFRPIVYTITPFVTARCLEQIKVGVGYHRAPVTIVGTGSGLSYSELGPTHHSNDDIALIKTIPGLNILSPADPEQLKKFLDDTLQQTVPTYIRLAKKGEPSLHHNISNIGIGELPILRTGPDALLISVGPILSEALMACEILESHHINITVANLSTIKPFPREKVLALLSNHKHLFTLEEHYKSGGIGSSLLEFVSDEPSLSSLSVTRFGVAHDFIHDLGKQAYVRKSLGLDASSIANQIRDKLSTDR